jgi:hypothetical protein
LNQWMTKTRWKWVCLQEQSQVPGFVELDNNEEFAASVEAVQALNLQIQQNGGQTLLILTWGRLNGDERNPDLFPNFETMQSLLLQGYLEYRDATTTSERPVYIAPVGLVFATIYKDLLSEGHDPMQPGRLFHQLYHDDGSHPSLAGSFLTAVTIYATLTGHNPSRAEWCPPRLDPNVCVAIKDAVHRTILQTQRDRTIEYPWPLPALSESTEEHDEL